MVIGKEPVARKLRLIGIKIPLRQMINPAVIIDSCLFRSERNVLEIVDGEEHFRMKIRSFLNKPHHHLIGLKSAQTFKFEAVTV